MDIMQYIDGQSNTLPSIQPESRIVYHYTSAESTKSILKKNSFYATDASFFMDAREIEYINELISKINYDNLKFIDKDFFMVSVDNIVRYFLSYNSVFIICFSTEDRNLSMWNSYTETDGYALGFNTTKLRDSLKRNIDFTAFNIKDGRVIYNEERQLELINQIVNSFDSILLRAKQVYPMSEEQFGDVVDKAMATLVEKVFLASIFFKSRDFEFEYEYRFAFIYEGKVNNKLNLVDYRVKKGYLTPYLNVSFPRDILFRVLINPKMVNKDLASFGLTQFLKKLGYSGYVEKTTYVRYRYYWFQIKTNYH